MFKTQRRVTANLGLHIVGSVLLFALASTLVPQPAWSMQDNAAVIAYTDILSGPNAGGENNKGIYLSIFGRHLGLKTGLGITTRVFIGGVEVDNYRYLGASKGRQDIQQLSVQVGAIGYPAIGVPLPIIVTIDGKQVPNPNKLTFTVNPGSIYFAAPDGNDTAGTTTGGGFSNPFRTIQNPTGANLKFSIDPASVSGAYGRLRAGDFLVLRGGTYSAIGFAPPGSAAGEGYFLQTLNKSGCPIGDKCMQGGSSSSGPITIMGYPGEWPFIDRTNRYAVSKFGGGISSADSARQSQGYGAWWTIVGLRIESGFNDGPINVQRGDVNPLGANWRVVNNELTMISCKFQSKCRAGGIAGSGNGNNWIGNFIHDVFDLPDGITDFENHGIYIGGDGSYDISYNRIEAIPGGNGIQTHKGNTNINNVNIHHNFIADVGKHGINLADGSQNAISIWNNLILRTGLAGLRMGGSSGLRGMRLYNNTFVETNLLENPLYGAITNDMMPLPGQVDIQNNIFWPHRGTKYHSGSNNPEFRGAVGTITNNLWFGGPMFSRTIDSQPVSGNPKFVDSPAIFFIADDSPAANSGSILASSLVRDDYYVRSPRLYDGKIDIGAVTSLRAVKGANSVQ